MESAPTPPIPPPGQRSDYIRFVDRTKLGIWILKRNDENKKALDEAVASGLGAEQVKESAGIFFYAPVDKNMQVPTAEFVKAVESAYASLEQEPEKFLEDFKNRVINQEVWSFICTTDPWLRPREQSGETGQAVAEELLWDQDGKGVWVVNENIAAAAKLAEIKDPSNLTAEEKALIEAAGGKYYCGENIPKVYTEGLYT